MFNSYRKNLKIIVSEPAQARLPLGSPSALATYPSKPRLSTDVSTVSFPDHVSTISTNEQDLSIHSLHLTCSPRGAHCPPSPSYQSFPSPNKESWEQFQVLERILRGENENLKMQNELLMGEVQRLRQCGHRAREMQRRGALELEEVRLECEAQRRRADEMKEIILGRLAQLEGKIVQGDDFDSECGSILDALTLSESGRRN